MTDNTDMDQLIYKASLQINNSIKRFEIQKVASIINSEFPTDYAITDSGITAIGLAASQAEKEPKYKPHIKRMLETIAVAGPNYNHRDNFGRAPIHYACRVGSETATQFLL